MGTKLIVSVDGLLLTNQSTVVRERTLDGVVLVGTSSTFNNSNLITCFANDYGHDNWVVEALKAYTSNKDLIILISSSGTSKNIVNAAKYCKKNSFKLITFSGFKKNNPLSKLGDINFHIKSNQYNFIEMSHHILLVYLVDVFAKNKLKL